MLDTPPAPTGFQVLKRDRASSQIAEQLESVILNGRFRAGDRLPTERELAIQFGTSRSSVREGLRTLEQTGLVVVRRGAGGGAFVSAPGAGLVGQALHRLAQLGQFDLEHLYAARRLLEPGIAAEAASNASPDSLAQLETALGLIRALALEGHDTAAASRRFHYLLADATGNALLVLLNASLLELAERLDTAIPHRPRPVRLVVDDHANLLEAIRARDSARASELASEHLIQLRRQTLREQGAS